MIIIKRPVISVLIIYILFILSFNYLDFFKPENHSILINFVNKKKISVTGKVLNEPVFKNNKQQFVLRASDIDGLAIKEKILVNAPQGYKIKYGDIVCLTGKLSLPQKQTFPTDFDYLLYLQRDNIYTLFNTYNFERIENKANPVKRFSFAVRHDIANKLDAFFKEKYSSILKPMIIGDKQALNEEIKSDFIRTGVIHVLVVSGLHIGFCAAVFIFILKLTGLKLRYVYILTIPLLFIYVIITGANPPAVRAAIMASCILLSFVLNRDPLVYNAISLAALIILLINPQALFTASFQMSFIVTVGIIYLYPLISKAFGVKRNNIYRWLWNTAGITVAAQISLTPILILYFGQFSLISFIANILIVPATGFIIGLFIVFYVISFISSFLAFYIAAILSFVLYAVLNIAGFLAGVKYAVIDVKIPLFAEIIFYYAVLFSMIQYGNKNKKIIFSVISAGIIIMLFNPFEDRTFEKIYVDRNTKTAHIRNKEKGNVIILNEYKKDKYYFQKLEKYLTANGIYEIDEFYCNAQYDKAIMKRVNIKNIFITDDL